MKTYSLILIIINSIVFCTLSEAKATNLQLQFRSHPPPKISVPLGSSIIVECDAAGSPQPTIHWLKDGKRIIQNDFEDLEFTSSRPVDDISRMSASRTYSRLFIDCFNTQDEATYTCVAETSYSRISSQTKITLTETDLAATASAASGSAADSYSDIPAAINSASIGDSSGNSISGTGSSNVNDLSGPIAAMSQCTNPPPVRIHMWSHNIVETMENNVIIYCRSNNKKYISWTLPDDKLVTQEHKDKYEILESGDLLIKDLSWSDIGRYTCTISDEQGSDSISSFVYPAKKTARTTN